MTRIATRSGWKPMLVLTTVMPPASGVRLGYTRVQASWSIDRAIVFVVDMVSGVWKLDVHGALIHMPGPGFHWMTLDADDRFGTIQLPSGSGGDIARIGAHPTLPDGCLSSALDVHWTVRPISVRSPWRAAVPLQVMRAFLPTARHVTPANFNRLPALAGPLRDLNGRAGIRRARCYAGRPARFAGRKNRGVSTAHHRRGRDGGKGPDRSCAGWTSIPSWESSTWRPRGCRGRVKVTRAGQMRFASSRCSRMSLNQPCGRSTRIRDGVTRPVDRRDPDAPNASDHLGRLERWRSSLDGSTAVRGMALILWLVLAVAVVMARSTMAATIKHLQTLSVSLLR